MFSGLNQKVVHPLNQSCEDKKPKALALRLKCLDTTISCLMEGNYTWMNSNATSRLWLQASLVSVRFSLGPPNILQNHQIAVDVSLDVHYASTVAETTAIGFGDLMFLGGRTASRRYFFVRSIIAHQVYGWALMGMRSRACRFPRTPVRQPRQVPAHLIWR